MGENTPLSDTFPNRRIHTKVRLFVFIVLLSASINCNFGVVRSKRCSNCVYYSINTSTGGSSTLHSYRNIILWNSFSILSRIVSCSSLTHPCAGMVKANTC